MWYMGNEVWCKDCCDKDDELKTDSVTYYDNDGDEYDIYLREKVK